ncbi:MAG: tetratricopeptide repeat protein [Marinoscillum sp.]|uniref:tetratricopeptide repeat-containing sensor histidine kinase n=1 Tax=Marinoscillum sp. TaxID=2024838 RepID=UPI00330538C2
MKATCIIVLMCLFISISWPAQVFAQPPTGSPETLISQADSCAKVPDFQCALRLYEQALALGIDSRDSLTVLLALGDIRYQLGQFDRAYVQYEGAHKMAESMRLDYEKALALKGLAHILWRTGENIKATTFIIESIELSRKQRDTTAMITSSNILAGIYMSVGNLDDAGKLYQEALSMALDNRDSLNIAQSYEYLGVLEFFREDYYRAIDLYEKALLINLSMDRGLESGINYSNIAESLNKLGEYREALKYLKKGERVMKRYDFLSGLIFVYYTMGDTYTSLRQYDLGIEFYQQSLNLMEQSGETREKQMVYGLMAENFAAQNKFEEAFAYHKRHTAAKDSLFNITKNNQLEEIKAKYDLEKKEQENFFLAKENQAKEEQLAVKQSTIRKQYIMGGLLVVLLLIAIYLSIKLYRNKLLLSRANKTKDKMFGFIAHDLISPMGIIKSLADLLSPDSGFDLTKQERDNMMRDMHNSASSVLILLKDVLLWSIAQQHGYDFKPKAVNLREISQKNAYLYDLHAKSKEICIRNEVPPEIKAFADAKAVSTIIRNLISNAIKFTEKGGAITLSGAKETQAMVVLYVTDTGIGMTPSQLDLIMSRNELNTQKGTDDEHGSGLGLNLVKDFLKECKGRLNIRSQPNQGTTIEIYLPSAN